jgi:hypothetical protein
MFSTHQQSSSTTLGYLIEAIADNSWQMAKQLIENWHSDFKNWFGSGEPHRKGKQYTAGSCANAPFKVNTKD